MHLIRLPRPPQNEEMTRRGALGGRPRTGPHPLQHRLTLRFDTPTLDALKAEARRQQVRPPTLARRIVADWLQANERKAPSPATWRDDARFASPRPRGLP